MEIIYDYIGIGIGPFNLGLAALANNIKELNGIFIDKNESFNWHPGLMLPTAKMQVPFYADLVTLADPTSPFTYMNYLKQTGKLFRFAINESYFPYRSEYNEYCQWVVNQLNNLFFGYECKSISYDGNQQLYHVSIVDKQTKVILLTTRRVIVGVGSTPYFPDAVKKINHSNVFHASEYLKYKDLALMHGNIMLIGSGQSAAEIFQDLLPHINDVESLKWYTRSDRFYAMDYSKFALEMSSPDYIQYFYQLPKERKSPILKSQHDLYKGINLDLIDNIYQELYRRSLNPSNKIPMIQPNCELKSVHKMTGRNFLCSFKNRQTDERITEQTEVIILATGYKQTAPSLLDNIKQQINFGAEGQYEINEDYSIDNNHSIFVQNAEWHSHGFNSADLGLGPYRNAIIINRMRKRPVYTAQKAGTFQRFR